MALLSKQEILDADDLETREVDVPEWGGSVLVKALSGKDRDAYEASLTMKKGKNYERNLHNVRAKLVARCVIYEDGSRMFTDAEVNALGAKSAAALDRVFEVCAEMSRLSEEDVEELAGKSDSDPSDGSTSG